jgi:kynurenine 3-monooxygenase
VEFDLMIGADGAHSSVRYHMMKFTRMNYSQDYVDTLWCEFQIKPKGDAPSQGFVPSRFAISPNHLHIWPGKDFMFIAIASEVCLLFLSLFPSLSRYQLLA